MKSNYLKGIIMLGMVLGANCLIYGADTDVVMLEQSRPVAYAQPLLEATVGASAGKSIWDDYDTGDMLDKGDSTKPLLCQMKNFPEMRRALEELFDSFINGDGGFGPLYTTQINHWEKGLYDEPSQEVDYAGFMGTKPSVLYLAKNGMSGKLAEIAKLSFKDIKGTEWYAGQIPLAVYYGMVNGYEDGTFRGNQSVSRAEFATMYANALSVEAKPETYKGIYGNAWYAGNLHLLRGSSLNANHMNKTTINQGMTRGEVAMVLANLYNMEGVTKYQDMFVAGTLRDYKFSDIKGTTSSADLDMVQDKYGESGVYTAYMQKCKNPSKPPSDVLCAMLALNDMGVMVGDSNKNANWAQPVTRAEVITLFTKAELSAQGITRK